MIYRNIPEAAAEKLTVQAGDIDIATELSPDSVSDLQNDPRIKVVQGVGADILFLADERESRPDVRHDEQSARPDAVRYALDYPASTTWWWTGHHTTIDSPVGFLGAYRPDHAFKRDLTMATSLLAEAGYPNGFNIDLHYPTNFTHDGVSFDVVAQKIQSDLADVNINVTLKPGEINTELANYRAGSDGLVLWLWGPDYFDSNDYLVFLPEGSSAGEPIGPMPTQMRRSNSCATRSTSRRTMPNVPRSGRQAQDYLMRNGPWASVIQPGVYVAIRSNIGNYVWNLAWRVNPYILSKS